MTENQMTQPSDIFSQSLGQNAANFVPLSPLSFIKRTAYIYPRQPALVEGERVLDWRTVYRRACQFASALKKLGVKKSDTVSVMLPNNIPMYESHFGIPMSGAVLNTLNIRLDSASIAFMLEHSQAKVLITDPEFSGVIREALSLMKSSRPMVIDVKVDGFSDDCYLGQIDYESWLAQENDPDSWNMPSDEWDAISLNYTSGTTGSPKGVVYHHRGAYLATLGGIVAWQMPLHSVYLWTLPMFHCNGWTFPWIMAVQAGVNVCLRKMDAREIFKLVQAHQVTHFCAAPIVYSRLIALAEEHDIVLDRPLHGLISGAAPPSSVIAAADKMGMQVTHVYGATEMFGPAAICAKQPGWENLSLSDRTNKNSRQGVRYPVQEDMTVMDPETMVSVPWDGRTLGEIMFKGNIVMKGYLKNQEATEETLKDGWYHSGDLGVIEPDGYIKIRDRSKDVIISGGENISSLEVEEALYLHPAVIYAAVVAKNDVTWGEVPVAFLEIKEKVICSEEEIIQHCRHHLARFKVPKQVIFKEIPKTSTGKIQKFMLRNEINL